ncbi:MULTISPECIES: LysR family transcriptional regulator [unclassified Sphingobium]|uniref:LysR family transcriptional regulator n=1 Tax=unclassified Sphingobium TaxID=2611147 RepID=UPI0035A70AC8
MANAHLHIDGKAPRRNSSTRPDFNQLEVFLKVAETRSFAEAARHLGVSQPAVSQTIARLEEIYGGDLFERRRGSPVSLTPVGRAILPKAKLLLFTVDQQIERAIATSRSQSGSLNIGFHPALAYGPVGDAIAEMSQAKPGVALRFVEGTPGELYRQLNERSLDIIFSPLHPEIGASANVQERLWQEPLVVALPEQHVLSAAANVRWSDLSLVPLMLKSNQGDLTDYRALAARMGDLPFDCDLHDVSRGTLVEFVRRGLRATLLLASATLPHPGVRHLPIEEENAALWIEALWPHQDRNPLRHHLLASVRRNAQRRGFVSASRASD